MLNHKAALSTIAALGIVALLGACTTTMPMAANPTQPVASNPPPVPPGANAIWYSISFESGGTAISADGQKVISDVTGALQANPNAIATIIGRTDTVGSRDHNMRLSHRRADSVRDALVYRGGVPAARVETRWTGEGRQNVQTGDQAAAAGNRVVDIAIH